MAKMKFLPWLSDTPIHIHDLKHLEQLSQDGLATGLDMASFSPALMISSPPSSTLWQMQAD